MKAAPPSPSSRTLTKDLVNSRLTRERALFYEPVTSGWLWQLSGDTRNLVLDYNPRCRSDVDDGDFGTRPDDHPARLDTLPFDATPTAIVQLPQRHLSGLHTPVRSAVSTAPTALTSQ
jgi:hypothetical protein